MKKTKPTPKGFAVMSPEQARRIRSMGGKACMAKPGHAKKLGRKGGLNRWPKK